MTSRPMTHGVLVSLARCSLVLNGHTILDDVSFTLRRGERWVLSGPNGSGKTLLLKMIRGDIWPTPLGTEQRQYSLPGIEPSAEPAGSKELIAYVGPERQDKYLRRDWNLSVREVVTTGLFDEDIPLSQPTRTQTAKVTRLLRRFGIASLERRRFLALSYGQRKRVLIARAYAGEPAVMLLDEVFNGLDTGSRQQLKRALGRSSRGGPAWVLSTHRAEDIPVSATHIAHIRHGRIVAVGPRDQVPASLRKISRRIAELPLKQARHGRTNGRPLVRIRDVDVYRDYRPVLKRIDWTLNRGEHWGVLGRNGSGKSTLIALLHGDLHPALGGVIERAGIEPGTPIANWKRRTGWVSPELQAEQFRAGTLEEIVMTGRYASVGLNDSPTRTDRQVAGRWLEYFGLTALAVRSPREVSYGQMRLTLFARAMAADPELLLLDEPFTGLDADLREHLKELVEALARSGTQIVMAVHHDTDLIPSIDRVLVIGKEGRVSVRKYTR